MEERARKGEAVNAEELRQRIEALHESERRAAAMRDFALAKRLAERRLNLTAIRQAYGFRSEAGRSTAA